MDRGWGTVRTTGGELTVDRDALHHHVSPRKRVNGELARFRTGTTGQRLSAVGTILGLALFPLAVAFRLTAAAGSADLTVLFPGLITGLTALQFWNQYVRDVRIPRGAVEELALDTKHRELTVKHSDEKRHLPTLKSAPYTTTFELPTDDEVRDLRALLRSVGLDAADADDADASEPDPVPCANCGTRVSPDAGWCPSCSSVLGVARATREA